MSTPQSGASSSSSSSSTHSFTHDVFLSFRGEDTRNNFTGHLYNNLVKEGINTFIDNDLTRGEDIRKELLDVIEGSRISVVVFSANYASSKWCLDELVKIIQCRESKQQTVYPIFFKIHPSEIRHQRGQVADHLGKYKDNLEKVESWKSALRQAATLSGWHIKDGEHEANFIHEIVTEISTEVTKVMKYIPLDVATYPVGIESRVEEILKFLSLMEDDRHMIGIWGIGGIGKTTLAKAVYNSISHKFEHSCFLANVREESNSYGGLINLQNNLLSKIIERNPPTVANVHEGITVLKQKLSKKRVLLVLDDVDNLNQLRNLAGGCDWFGPKSRIIITTRDTNLLEAHKVNLIYEVKELNHEEALELFNFNAFKGNKRMDDFSELATDVIRYVKGIPLALEVLGSDLCSKNKDEWKDALDHYSRYPKQEIQQTLQRSYEALDDSIKEVFLHIACFFKGDEKSYVIDVLESCDLNAIFSLKVLTEKALIKIGKEKYKKIWMHDLIEDMGKEIVRQESPHEAGKRSRLWDLDDIRKVLEKNTGTEKIKGIVLHSKGEKIQLNRRSFKNLKNLQIFQAFGSSLDGESVDYLPDHQLRVLNCSSYCSLRSLPKSFNPTELRMLHMEGACTIPLVNKGFKNMKFLKSIRLCRCNGLTEIPDLSGLASLKELDISECDDLVEVDPSVGCLDKLVILVIRYCKKLEMFSIDLKSLETLDLTGCPLEFFPEIEGDKESLKHLTLDSTSITELPSSVGNLTGLKSLSLRSCYKLTDIPLSIFYGLQCLEDLNLRNCNGLVTFPTMSPEIQWLVKLKPLPPLLFSTALPRLQVHLNDCQQLQEISEFPREIDSLDVSGCESLLIISKLGKLLDGVDSKMYGWLNLTDCQELCYNLALEAIRLKKSTGEREEEVERVEEEDVWAGDDVWEAEEDVWEGEAEERRADEDAWNALFDFFFACAKSEEFQVEFPTKASIPIPYWLTCSQDVNWGVNSEVTKTEHEFSIEIPENCKGLALCLQSRRQAATDSWGWRFGIKFYINGIKFDEKTVEYHYWDADQVWMHYIPLAVVIRRLSECGMPPPDMFRVMFRLKENYIERGWSVQTSWGVQVIDDGPADFQYTSYADSTSTEDIL